MLWDSLVRPLIITARFAQSERILKTNLQRMWNKHIINIQTMLETFRKEPFVAFVSNLFRLGRKSLKF